MRPAFLDEMSWSMAEVYGAVTDRILINLAKYFPYVKPGEELPGAFEYQARMLAKMGQVNRETADIIMQSLDGADAALRGALETAILDALKNEEPKLRKAAEQGLLGSFIPPEAAPGQMQAFKSYYAQSADKLNLVNTVMLESTKAAYTATVSDVVNRVQRTQSILNTGAGEVITGVSSWNTAMHDAVQKMVKNGLTGFIDHAGHRWSPEAYVAMDIRTTMFNTSRAAINERAQEYGCDLYQVSSHNGARPLCYPWQGKVISRSGWTGTVEDLDGNKVTVHSESEIESFRYGGGLFGVNCGHYPMNFIPGVSSIRGEPQDPEENAKTYEESQQQRALERKLRAERRDLEVMKAQGADEVAIKAQRDKIRKASADIDQFCEDTGRARRRNREYAPVNATWPKAETYDATQFPTQTRDQVREFLTGTEVKEVPDATNIFGEEIQFSPKLDSAKWDRPKETIRQLATEYKTKLKEVLPGAHQGAGDVQVSGTIMHLSSNELATSIHEFAHSISMERQTKYGLYDEAAFWKEIRSIRTAYRKNLRAADDAPRLWVSSYEHSSKEIDEFMAEAFALGYMREKGIEPGKRYNGDTQYSALVLDAVKRYFGK